MFVGKKRQQPHTLKDKKKMKKGLITSILMLTFGSVQAQSLPVIPKLVVTLTIDQLCTDHLEDFAPLYGEGGFRRLMREGKVFTQVDMPFAGADRASALATLYTGSTPSVHGIIGENWLDAKTLRPVDCVDDPAFMGNYTNESTSPSQLLVSTLADELRIATANRSLVYAIAPFREAAIIGAGHAGNGAFWLNEQTGKWCGTTYYPDFPAWMDEVNGRQAPDTHIKDIVWTPLLPAERYTCLPGEIREPFKYKPANEGSHKYSQLARTPFINDEVNRLAETLLDKGALGRDNVPDLLALTYYAGRYNRYATETQAMETQDMYVRLDRSIASLLEMLDSKVGLQNVLLCITSTGYVENAPADFPLYRLPGGEFYLNRCATLLNMFLMATYGEGQYVEAYYGRQIYLNHKLIEDKQLSLPEIQEKAAEFLVQFSGVNEVYSANRLLLGAWSPKMELIRNSFHRLRSGDLLIEVLPGWTVMHEDGTEHYAVRTCGLPAPLILLGNGIAAETIRIPVSAARIAPTLAGAMRIRAPNACTESPLVL